MNALTELIDNLKARKKSPDDILWAAINNSTEWAVLKLGYSDKDVEKFMLALSKIDYDNGHKETPELYGVVIFKDNTWFERNEYNGAEWWEYKVIPNYTRWMIAYKATAEIRIFDP